MKRNKLNMIYKQYSCWGGGIIPSNITSEKGEL